MIQFSTGNLKQLFTQMFKKVNEPYILKVVNTTNYRQVLSLELTKKSLYLLFASFFVAIFLLFSGLIFFTPLKYYIPGNRSNIARSKVIHLQKLTDSLIDLNQRREQFIFNLIQVSNGGWDKNRDTTQLSKQEISKAIAMNWARIDRASRYEYLKHQKIDTAKAKGDVGLNTDVSTEELEEIENALKNVLIKDSTLE